MRNRLAHDYSHVDRAIVWETISDGIEELDRIAQNYIEKRGLEKRSIVGLIVKSTAPLPIVIQDPTALEVSHQKMRAFDAPLKAGDEVFA